VHTHMDGRHVLEAEQPRQVRLAAPDAQDCEGDADTEANEPDQTEERVLGG